jgi:hypothetical protein
LGQEWASEEAEVRLARAEEGKPVEYGKYYHKQKLAIGYKPDTVDELDGPTLALEEEEEDE